MDVAPIPAVQQHSFLTPLSSLLRLLLRLCWFSQIMSTQVMHLEANQSNHSDMYLYSLFS